MYPRVRLAFCCLLVTCTFLYSQDKPLPQAADSSKQAYVIENSVFHIVFEADGTAVKERTMQCKVIADAGVKQLAVLTFTYSNATEALDIVYVRVHKPDGTIIITPDYNIQDMPAEVTRSAPIYRDIHEKHVAVKALGVGDILEYQIRQRTIKPEIPIQFWLEYSFTKSTLVKNEVVEVSVPLTKSLKIASPENKPVVKEADGRRTYIWQHANLMEPSAEDDSEEDDQKSPSIQLSTFDNWEEIGRWYASLQSEAVKPTPAITAKSAELTMGMTKDQDKIRALYNYVSLQVHYVGLDFGIGRYQPHPAQDVLENQYGDCKDKHTLFAALMKAAGYDVWPALIHSTRKLKSDVPSLAQFDHVISVVPLGGKLIWLDTTPEVAPFELLLHPCATSRRL
jgi:transglutaminase-like putative cysteine protease